MALDDSYLGEQQGSWDPTPTVSYNTPSLWYVHFILKCGVIFDT